VIEEAICPNETYTVRGSTLLRFREIERAAADFILTLGEFANHEQAMLVIKARGPMPRAIMATCVDELTAALRA
jgi:hypothetical protein